MNDILFQFLEILMTFFFLSLFALVCRSAIDYLKNKTECEKARETLDDLENMLTSVVNATTQTYVVELKQTDSFDREAQKIAFEKSFSAAKKLLTEKSVAIITENFGDLDAYLTQKIEEKVLLCKG